MAKYVLGDEGARKFKQLLQKDLASGNSQRYGRSPALDNAYPHPYEVRWSNSLLSTNGEPGGYMMWLPDNCLYVDLSCIKSEDFPQISADKIKLVENTDKWYELTPDALSAGSQWPNSFDIWLNDYLSAPVFSVSATASAGVEPIHITRINNYRPCPSVKSSINIGGKKVAPDERSVSLSSDTSGLSSYLSADWNHKLRITGFHTYSDSTAYGGGTSFIVRQGGNGIAEPPTGNEYIDYLNVNSFKSDILQNVADTLSNDTSALAVDEQSVSKGGDGWVLSSDGKVQPQLHMWHFHDSAADVNNPEMCDIVLRYNPERASDDKWLRYISYEDLKAKLSSDIGGGGGGGGGGEVTPDQLSAIPCWGMFAWTESTRTIGPGGCMVGRKWYTCTSGIGSGKSDNLYQLRVTIAQGGGVSLAVVSDASLGQAPTTTQCWIPIYQITNGKIAADYRGAFVVPAYE